MKRLTTIGMREVHITKLHIGLDDASKARRKHYGWLWLFLAVALVLFVCGIIALFFLI